MALDQFGIRRVPTARAILHSFIRIPRLPGVFPYRALLGAEGGASCYLISPKLLGKYSRLYCIVLYCNLFVTSTLQAHRPVTDAVEEINSLRVIASQTDQLKVKRTMDISGE